MRLDCFFTRVNGKFKAILFENVLYLKAKKNYTEVITIKGNVLICTPLSKVEEKMPENLFCRIHRSCIVSVNAIKEFDHHAVYLQECTLSISQQYFDSLMERLIVICPEQDAKLKKEIEELSIEEYLKTAWKEK